MVTRLLPYHRNERPWGTPAYVKALRASLDAAGFHRY
eukprot:COSAG06_NODE_47040_length_342_cov_0.938272_1_plen_36_part_10